MLWGAVGGLVLIVAGGGVFFLRHRKASAKKGDDEDEDEEDGDKKPKKTKFSLGGLFKRKRRKRKARTPWTITVKRTTATSINKAGSPLRFTKKEKIVNCHGCEIVG